MYENKGLLYSIMDTKGEPVGIPLKASQIYCKPTLANLEKHFGQGKKKREPHKGELKALLDQLLAPSTSLSRAGLQAALMKYNVDLVYRTNASGQLYGVTYIDHAAKTVFNGSELGKGYSAMALSERFARQESRPDTLTGKGTGEAGKREANLQVEMPGYQEKSQQPGLLETLLSSSQADGGMKIPKRRKKRKKGKIIQQEQQLTL